ncbi:hypothetical protein TVAG_390400 [Trichomonas vaginalis G3]|uniref:Uncharacterized protein n=1 Tax=Trichomonas vaginalis (strain ATCC PRA-98 / G3) TaxID=412133 RepID=A2ESU4_TRIV3|nr:hypothetical protein TVAGG3_0182010 [Trichomonas vaginalis G3]EAY04270.1 hypothetical protein TVAG_390400 [Trichomonas vaginalis G3]KAI5549363.1 hypothetical protein TVAGG3_0182010 [Trichomonas vaginalis G3]|eukprot:XP_001316493.1 hypothetical protein [Trichomonas vaginalis G3]
MYQVFPLFADGAKVIQYGYYQIEDAQGEVKADKFYFKFPIMVEVKPDSYTYIILTDNDNVIQNIMNSNNITRYGILNFDVSSPSLNDGSERKINVYKIPFSDQGNQNKIAEFLNTNKIGIFNNNKYTKCELTINREDDNVTELFPFYTHKSIYDFLVSNEETSTYIDLLDSLMYNDWPIVPFDYKTKKGKFLMKLYSKTISPTIPKDVTKLEIITSGGKLIQIRETHENYALCHVTLNNNETALLATSDCDLVTSKFSLSSIDYYQLNNWQPITGEGSIISSIKGYLYIIRESDAPITIVSTYNDLQGLNKTNSGV